MADGFLYPVGSVSVERPAYGEESGTTGLPEKGHLLHQAPAPLGKGLY